MKLTELLLKNKKRFFFYLLGAFITTVGNLIMTLALATAFGILDVEGKGEILSRIGLTLIMALLPIGTQFISRFLRIGFMRDILVQVRELAYTKIMDLSVEEYRSRPSEHYMSKMVSDINLFEKDFFLSLLNIVSCFGGLILGEIVLLIVRPEIAGATLVITLILYFIINFFKNPAKAAKEETQKENSNYNISASNILNGLEVIKLFHVEEGFRPPFRDMVYQLEKKKKKSNMLDYVQVEIGQWIAGAYQTGMFVYAINLYVKQEIGLAEMILIFNLMGQLVWSMISGFEFINRFRTAVDVYNRITASIVRKTGKKEFNFENEILISELGFSYSSEKNAERVLESVNFSIRPGDKILIYGPSGTGKTTLVNCLTQSLAGYSGDILVDGISLSEIDHSSFLDHTGYIRQNHFMFEDSIKNNVILLEPYKEELFMDIMKKLNLYEWIRSLEDKEDHQLKENGGNISGGQKQRISIARQLYRNSDLLFVDEPSASLDDRTALLVYEALLETNRTILMISHRHLDYLREKFPFVLT